MNFIGMMTNAENLCKLKFYLKCNSPLGAPLEKVLRQGSLLCQDGMRSYGKDNDFLKKQTQKSVLD